MRTHLRSLRSMSQLPVPRSPRVKDYGKKIVGHAHDLYLFPAIIREKESVQAEAIIEQGQASCFFHPNFPATAVCDLSGRMICDLCKTEWEGKTVSFEALQSQMTPKGKKDNRTKTYWDDICLGIMLLSLLFILVAVVTGPIVLGIIFVNWRKGPTSVVRTSRWRYVVAGILAVLEFAASLLLWYSMYFD